MSIIRLNGRCCCSVIPFPVHAPQRCAVMVDVVIVAFTLIVGPATAYVTIAGPCRCSLAYHQCQYTYPL